jgi:4-amino-4-deoxy-L-arabinose transferase-like glycosyltransferase
MVTLMTFSTPFSEVLREDAYYFLIKGFEIREGNWVPMHSHSIGWSVILAVFLKVFGIRSIFDGMVLSRGLSILIMGLSIFPFSGLADKLTDKKSAIVAVFAFALSPVLIHTGGSEYSGYSEPLFILLVISTVYYLADSDNKPRDIFIAAILASFSYYVRPNGIFMLGVILLYLAWLIWYKKANLSWSFLPLVPFLFFLVSLPDLYMRYAAYGSAFDFDKNSQYFADLHAQMSPNNSSAPSIIDYIKTHSINNYFRKFIYYGLFRIAIQFYFLLGEVWLVLFFLGSINYIIKEPVEYLDSSTTGMKTGCPLGMREYRIWV